MTNWVVEMWALVWEHGWLGLVLAVALAAGDTEVGRTLNVWGSLKSGRAGSLKTGTWALILSPLILTLCPGVSLQASVSHLLR